jgi:hypothetical protein
MQFLRGEFGPGMAEAGLQLTDAWYTIYGEGPQVLAAGVTDTLEGLREILTSEEWQRMEAKLLTMVDNYQRRIVEATVGFQF